MSHSVLIIEDEVTLAKNMKIYLQRQGYDVAVAPSGEEGLEQFDTFHPDLVLLDYRLPRMNGLDVLNEIQSHTKPVKTIMITGHGNHDIAMQARQAGAYEYRSKPMPLSDLARLVESALGTPPHNRRTHSEYTP
jgi:two-component system, NtrC family, response regulator AtoC